MIAAALLALALVAQAPAQAPPGAQQPPAPPAREPAPADPPSLDDALGIGGGPDRSASEREEKVDRSLAGAKPRDILESALADMRRSKELLESSEPGIPARRAQESVVRKLDELIASAERMQQERDRKGGKPQDQQAPKQGQRKPGKQGSTQDGEQEGQDGEERPKGGQQGGRRKGESDDGRRSASASDADAEELPPNVDPTTMDAQFDESRAEWGRLPPRVRDAVRQGFRDPMSAAYRRLTQEYYRRLAEERGR